jgi:hypothetical protein
MIPSSSPGPLNSLHWQHAMRSPPYTLDISFPQLWDGRPLAASSDQRCTRPGFSRAKGRAICRFPTEFELMIDLKTAKTLRVDVPSSLLRAPTR